MTHSRSLSLNTATRNSPAHIHYTLQTNSHNYSNNTGSRYTQKDNLHTNSSHALPRQTNHTTPTLYACTAPHSSRAHNHRLTLPNYQNYMSFADSRNTHSGKIIPSSPHGLWHQRSPLSLNLSPASAPDSSAVHNLHLTLPNYRRNTSGLDSPYTRRGKIMSSSPHGLWHQRSPLSLSLSPASATDSSPAHTHYLTLPSFHSCMSCSDSPHTHWDRITP
jgi:hypothetical protein